MLLRADHRDAIARVARIEIVRGRGLEPITLERCRKLLGEEAETLTDAFSRKADHVQDARAICHALFGWDHDAHHHSGLRCLTPADVHYGRAATRLDIRYRTRLAAHAAHPERFVHGPPRRETLPEAVWINAPTKTAREDAPGTTIVTPDDPQHGVIDRPQVENRPIVTISSAAALH